MQLSIGRIKMMLADVRYYIARAICWIGLGYYRFSDRDISKLSKRILHLQFWAIGKPFINWTNKEVYEKSYFKYRWQYHLWHWLSDIHLSVFTYPSFEKKRREKELAWMSLATIRYGFGWNKKKKVGFGWYTKEEKARKNEQNKNK